MSLRNSIGRSNFAVAARARAEVETAPRRSSGPWRRARAPDPSARASGVGAQHARLQGAGEIVDAGEAQGAVPVGEHGDRRGPRRRPPAIARRRRRRRVPGHRRSTRSRRWDFGRESAAIGAENGARDRAHRARAPARAISSIFARGSAGAIVQAALRNRRERDQAAGAGRRGEALARDRDPALPARRRRPAVVSSDEQRPRRGRRPAAARSRSARPSPG